MRAKKSFLLSIVVLCGVALVAAGTPSREGGLSVHFQPERIGKMKGETGGFDVSPQKATKERKLVATAAELMTFVKTLPPDLQNNGIWVVTTHPAAYSESELKQLEALADLCKAAKVPLFVARASELPNGWQRRA
jgi:hypothetical protein